MLRPILPARGLVLEIASGSGEHVVAFARELPDLVWQPSDPSAEARVSIAAWLAAEALPNVRAPLDLDVQRAPWPIDAADAILCINMIHISPWSATEGLMRGAGATGGRRAGCSIFMRPYIQQGAACRLGAEQYSPSTPICGCVIQTGDCASSMQWRNVRRQTGFGSNRSSPCRRIICRWCSVRGHRHDLEGSGRDAEAGSPSLEAMLPPGIRSRMIAGVNGLDMHILEAGFEMPGRPLVLLAHGYPRGSPSAGAM